MNEMNRCCGCQQNQPYQYAPANTCNCQPMPCMPAPGCFESCCQVMEAPICHQPEFHHFHKVEHVVPVYINNLHHHHTHHEYQTQQQQTFESLGYDYYHQNPAVAQAAMPMVNDPMMMGGQPMMMPEPMVAGQQMMMPNGMVAGQQMMMPNGMVAGQQMMMPEAMVAGKQLVKPEHNLSCDCTCTMTKPEQMVKPTPCGCGCKGMQYPQMF